MLSVVFVIISVVLSIRRTVTPNISSITPSEGVPGESVIISGRGFGASKTTHYVQFSNCNITSKSIISWSENEITLIVPEDVQSGFVKVGSKNNISNGVFFTNTDLAPKKIQIKVEPQILSEDILQENTEDNTDGINNINQKITGDTQ